MNLTISLTEELAAFVNGKVSEGRYESAGEVVQAALSLMQRQETAKLEGLRKACQKGLADAERRIAGHGVHEPRKFDAARKARDLARRAGRAYPAPVQRCVRDRPAVQRREVTTARRHA